MAVPVFLISATLGFGVSSCGFPFSAAVCAFEKKFCEDLSLFVQVFSCRDIVVFLLSLWFFCFWGEADSSSTFLVCLFPGSRA